MLKIDCEACEYNLIEEEEATRREFSQIMIEYHYGPDRLAEKLRKAGFRVEYTPPKPVFNPQASNPNMFLGYLSARM